MTQTEVAERANITQSVVSAYESSKREPSFETLRRLIAATGFDLDVVLVPAAPKSPQRQAVDQNRVRLQRALTKLGARYIRLFGSVARGDDGPESDIDLLVDVEPDVGSFVVPANSLKPDVAERVLAEAIPL